MNIEPIKTRVLIPPKDDLLDLIKEAVESIPEKSILAITSKVVSIWQGRCVKDSEDKDALIKKEADFYIPREVLKYQWVTHTIKNNIMISSAGIDHSNGDGYYILWPENIKETVAEIRGWIKDAYKVKDVGVMVTDSKSSILRRGTSGISLGHSGFISLKDYRGEKDIFGGEMRVSVSNVVDPLADISTLVMGEGGECTPLALITELPDYYFEDLDKISEKEYSSLELAPEDDMFIPLIDKNKWKRGLSGK